MAGFIDIIDNQLYIAAIHSDLLECRLGDIPRLRGLTKIVQLALKTFSLAVYLHYPSQRCSYIIKKPIVVLGCTGVFVLVINMLEEHGYDNSKFFKELFDCLRIVSGFLFTYKFLKASLADIKI